MASANEDKGEAQRSTSDERDDSIVEHIRVFHLSTPEIIHHLFFSDVTLNAVRKVTGRLVRERRIRPCTLFGHQKYFVLTETQAAALGEDRSIGRPFQFQGLVNAYGVLLFCAEHGFAPYSRKTFEAAFPELVIRGVRSGNYYIDVDESGPTRKSRLGFILVDYGSSSENVVRKVRKIVSRAYKNPAFSRFIQRGNFVVAIVTPTTTKRSEIRAALENEAILHVVFRIEPFPELEALLLQKHTPPKSAGATPPPPGEPRPVKEDAGEREGGPDAA